MAEAAANIQELLSEVIAINREIDRQRGGDEVVWWIKNQLETLKPQLESIEGLPNEIEELSGSITKLRHAMGKAEDLVQTYFKRVIQRNTATIKTPIYVYRVRSITKQLDRIKDDITRYSDELATVTRLALREAVIQPATPAPADQTVPFYLRRCIHYFQLFPPKFQVPARRLIALWVAEGLVHSKKYENKSVEQIAQRYLCELIDLQVVVVKRKRSGKVRSCVIDANKRDQLLGNANSSESASFLQDRDGPIRKIRRLVDCNGSSESPFIQIPAISQPLINYREVISFLSFNTAEGSKPGEDIGDFLRKCISKTCFIWLRVLDLERVFRPKLPKTLGKLLALRYLGLRWTYMEHLPDSVNKMFNLEVLDVKHTYISVLPTSIWTMEYLRHLYLSEAYRTRFPDPPSRITLTALQTLWGAFVDEDTCVVNGLDTLLNIRKLGLSCRSRDSTRDPKQLKAIDKWISKLEFLETLRLKSRDESGKAADLHLTSLMVNEKLSTVYLLGKLDPSILCKLPLSLTEITLSGSELDLDPMEFLEMLPNLVILQLLGQSVVCRKMHCSISSFRRLKVFWIWKLENLEEFEAEEGSLPCLEELEIRSCNKLGKLPDRLEKLLKIKLTSMPPEFVDKTRSKYAKVQHVPGDDQYILTNTV